MTSSGKSLKDVKAKQIAKRRKARRRKRVLFLIIEIFILFVLMLMAYGLIMYGKIDKTILNQEAIKVNEGVSQNGYTTIALFGGDSREGKLGAGTHTDTMMVVSIDNKTKEIKIVSVYRDMLSRQMNGTMKKANNAYFVGGPEEAINMLNENLDLDIMYYVTVDFNIVTEAVDIMGGIDVELTEAEEKVHAVMWKEFHQNGLASDINNFHALRYNEKYRDAPESDDATMKKYRLPIKSDFKAQSK